MKKNVSGVSGGKNRVKFTPFIPSLPSQDTLRLILEYAIGPEDKHILFKWARRLCKRSILLIEHPNFIQMRGMLTPRQSVTEVRVASESDLATLVQGLKVLLAYRVKLTVAEGLLSSMIQAL